MPKTCPNPPRLADELQSIWTRNSEESPDPLSLRSRGIWAWLAGRLVVRPLRYVEDLGWQAKELEDQFVSKNAEIANPLSDLAEKLEFLCESA